jgi:hypothetical protein
MTPEQIEQAVAIVNDVIGGQPKYEDYPVQVMWHWYGKGRSRPTRVAINKHKDGKWKLFVGIWAWPSYCLEWQRDAYLLARALNNVGIPYQVYRDGNRVLTFDEREFRYDHMTLTGIRGDEFDYFNNED